MADINVGKILSSAASGAATGTALFPGLGTIGGAAGGAAIDLALQVAPQISKWLIGDDATNVATQVVNTVQAVVGTNHLTDATQLDTTTRTNLALELAKIDQQREESRLNDIADARNQTIELAKAGSKIAWGAPVVSVVITSGFFITLNLLLFINLPLDGVKAAILNILIGTLATLVVQVANYWLGSSSGSARKTDILAANQRQTSVQQPQSIIIHSPNQTPIPQVQQPAPPQEETPQTEPVQVQPISQPVAPNRKAFFDSIRQTVFNDHLVQSQVDGCNKIIDYWNENYPTGDVRHLANVLAQTAWETGRTMQPIEEYGKGHGKPYYPCYGRGLIQLTWLENYQKMSPIVGVNLAANPEKALEWPIALKIAFEGMLKGLFTGKKLSDYFNATTDDAIGARAIVNGTDHAREIAQYHVSFLAALQAEQKDNVN